ncbi:MAG TPA: T9SS type A sorting domain-containing protein, partial [Flavisolibacter sp.]
TIKVLRGVVIATQAVTEPISHFDARRGAFVTRVPLGFSSTADIFITGAIVNSKNGFSKSKNAGSILSGVFRSTVSFDGQWNYAMAAYRATSTANYIQYNDLAAEASVVAMSTSSLKAGTPVPWIPRITAGGTGNGGSNYTGSPSNYDNFTSCVPTVTNTRIYLTSAGAGNAPEQTALVQETALQVYPNPARDHVTLSFLPPVAGRATIRIFGVGGRQMAAVYRGTMEANQLFTRKIDTQQWPAGVYFIQVVLNDRVINRKLVISP